MINKFTIQVFNRGYTSLLHEKSEHSIEYYNKLLNINFKNILKIIDCYGNLINKSDIDLYKMAQI